MAITGCFSLEGHGAEETKNMEKKLFYCQPKGETYCEFYVIMANSQEEALEKLTNELKNPPELEMRGYWKTIYEESLVNPWKVEEIKDGIFRGEWS